MLTAFFVVAQTTANLRRFGSRSHSQFHNNYIYIFTYETLYSSKMFIQQLVRLLSAWTAVQIFPKAARPQRVSAVRR